MAGPVTPIAAFAFAAVMLAAGARAEPFTIMDKEGFGAPMEAITLTLPPGWTADGRIAWQKPCSANALYEIILTARAPDGRSGLRIMPGHSVQWLGVTVDGTVDPMIAQLAQAQVETARNEMRTAFQKSNCHVGEVSGTQAILDTLVLSKRPAGARVERITPDETRLAAYRSSIGQQVGGMVTRFDAVTVDLAYPAHGETVERLWLSWYQFADDPQASYMRGMPTNHFQATTIEALTFAFAPRERAGDLDTLAQALKEARVHPAWQAKVQEVQRKAAEEQARARQQSEAERKMQEAKRDEQHRRFLETIRE